MLILVSTPFLIVMCGIVFCSGPVGYLRITPPPQTQILHLLLFPIIICEAITYIFYLF